MKCKSPNNFSEQRILKAASTVLAQYGYERATIRLIAAEAGVSRGLLHYYFKSKEEILAQVIKESTKVGTAMVAAIFDLHNTPEGYAAAITSLFKNALKTDPDLFYFFIEGVNLTKRSKVLKSELADSYVKWRQAFEIGFNQAREKQHITPNLPVKALAALISALIDGMALQFLSEPELIHDDFIWESFEACVAHLLGSRN